MNKNQFKWFAIGIGVMLAAYALIAILYLGISFIVLNFDLRLIGALFALFCAVMAGLIFAICEG